MSNICVRITNPMRANKNGHLVGEWVGLPITQDELEEVLVAIGIADEYFISESDTELFDIPVDNHTSLTELNKLVERIDEVDEAEQYKRAALIEIEGPEDFNAVYDIIDKLDEFDFLSEIQDDYTLGKYFALDCDMLHGTPEDMKYFFHFERFGSSMRYRHKIIYTSLGAIYRK